MSGYMTASEFEKEMAQIKTRYEGDHEGMHRAMDELMVTVLRQHGFDAGCDIFEKERWL
jgi:hypothetical protein